MRLWDSSRSFAFCFAAVFYSGEMAADTIGERFTEEDSDGSSWSSAFDPLPVPPPKSTKKKRKHKKSKKKKKTKMKKKSKRKDREPPGSSDSAEILAAGQVGSPEQSNLGNSGLAFAESLQPTDASPGRALPDIEDMGEYVFLAVWQPTAPPPRLNRTRACAKLLVRSGLRCSCHFRHVNSCPNRATSSPAPQLPVCLVSVLGFSFETTWYLRQAVTAENKRTLSAEKNEQTAGTECA